MESIIIYGSLYGTTQCYAEELSRRTGIYAADYNTVKNISEYKEIIYLGGLYAGGVKGLKDTIKLLPKDNQIKLMIITVGLADVTDRENTDNIKKGIEKQIPKAVYDNARIFHLRGGIDYAKLSFMHKIMMSIVYRNDKKIPEEQRSAEAREMIETYNDQVDFVNFGDLDKIIDLI